ncbi:hypothetical protein R3P38DRAFT_2879858 [Favolaschia claudopus]|uniref:Secreted protein n=1 Tax=Favolaschia claudopus TaxID=2862362 RepID=A0AAW0D0W8_9AGAR
MKAGFSWGIALVVQGSHALYEWLATCVATRAGRRRSFLCCWAVVPLLARCEVLDYAFEWSLMSHLATQLVLLLDRLWSYSRFCEGLQFARCL